MRSVRASVDPSVQILKPGLKVRLVVLPRHAISAGCGFALECKFARNNDPLRGDFASNSDPS